MRKYLEILNVVEAQNIRQKIGEFDYIKIKDFSPIKDTLNEVKTCSVSRPVLLVTAWEMLALSKIHRRLVATIL